MSHFYMYSLVTALLCLTTSGTATTFRFDKDPFAGTNVRSTPGRQVVGGEEFISFFVATDIFSLDANAFGVSDQTGFANAVANNLPQGGVNVVILENLDDDDNPLTPFNAGTAANLIANRITTAGAGFFIYFNQGLDIPRLVYSTDLSSTSSDLRILARMLNLSGQPGRDALSTFTASNFEITSAVPEPSAFRAMALAVLAFFFVIRKRTQSERNSS